MKQHSKLSSEQQQEQASATQSQEQAQAARDFATAEALLRHDAGQIPVPPRIAQRLAESSANIPPPNRSWWKKLFGH